MGNRLVGLESGFHKMLWRLVQTVFIYSTLLRVMLRWQILYYVLFTTIKKKKDDLKVAGAPLILDSCFRNPNWGCEGRIFNQIRDTIEEA